MNIYLIDDHVFPSKLGKPYTTGKTLKSAYASAINKLHRNYTQVTLSNWRVDKSMWITCSNETGQYKYTLVVR